MANLRHDGGEDYSHYYCCSECGSDGGHLPTCSHAASVPPKPPTLSEARSLIGLIEELASLVADHRAMGIGEVSIANAIRALYMDRWLDQWCNSVEAEPLEESLIDRIESRRSAVRTLMLENAESERTVAALRAEVAALVSAIDNELVTSGELGTFKLGDDPKAALHKLACWNQSVGAYFAARSASGEDRTDK